MAKASSSSPLKQIKFLLLSSRSFLMEIYMQQNQPQNRTDQPNFFPSVFLLSLCAEKFP